VLDSGEVTILTGVFATGTGETFDSAKLKILLAGSFYTKPANVPHYIEIKEDTVLQVSGTGLSTRKFVNPSDNPKLRSDDYFRPSTATMLNFAYFSPIFSAA
jgi:hypothetical protein